MNNVAISLGIIASVLVLCQWFVFQSVRTHLFQRCEGIRRRSAYPLLIGFGLVTIVAVRLEFGSEMFPPGTLARQVASILIFSYLGWALVASLVLLIVRAVDAVIEYKYAQHQAVKDKTNPCSWRGNESGCLSTSAGKNEAIRSSERSVGVATHIDYRYPTRRAFLKVATVSGLVAASGFGARGIAQAYSDPIVERYEFFHDRLDGLARPVTIIHATDFHFGMFLGRQELLHLVDQINSLEADALCITGDVFHSARTAVEQATPLLKKLKARALGSFAVLGNHDFYAGEARSVGSLREAGITILRNRWITIREGHTRIEIGGIDDPGSRWTRPEQFQGLNTLMKRAPVQSGLRILLSHRPGVFPRAAGQKIDLVLAGHVHGGQIVIPVPGRETGLSAADMISDYIQGWYKIESSRMYLNRGIGLTFLPWRIHCPPEICVIQLSPAERGTDNGFFRKT